MVFFDETGEVDGNAEVGVMSQLFKPAVSLALLFPFTKSSKILQGTRYPCFA
jgi:hypothetical protein